jgi:endoglucanase
VNFAAAADAAAPYRVGPALLDRVARVTDHATGLGLAVVVCNFQYPELMADPAAHRDRHLSIVDQISGRFREAPDTVCLEPLAEPHDRLDPLWNAYLADTLTVARAQHPTRPILAGPGFFNTVRALPALNLPAGDRHLIVALHHYWPLEFTFQGETWFTGSDTQAWLGTIWQPTPDRTAALDTGFAQIAHWSIRHDRPIFLGEFGTTSHADMPSRVAWTRYNRELAEQHGFSWCYWSYGPSYALRDAEHDDWHAQLIDALIPAGARHPRPIVSPLR